MLVASAQSPSLIPCVATRTMFSARSVSSSVFWLRRKRFKGSLLHNAAKKKQEEDEEEERLMLQKARELDEFDQQNHGALPRYSDRNHSQDKNGFHGADSLKTTSFEEESALRQ